MNDRKIKCIVWDLDCTIWDGILTEDTKLTLRPGILGIIQELDRRGILHSVCSKNDHGLAMEKLKEYGIDQYFLYPQINWNPKSDGIRRIQAVLNFGMDTFAFVDDQRFERDEVAFSLSDVLCIAASDIEVILDMPEMNPKFVTEDSVNRRKLYMNDFERDHAEERFAGPKDMFLKTLDMEFTIRKADEGDLKRMEELTVRTHQLNSTGIVYSYEELLQRINSPVHIVLVAQLKDKYGDYGKIGLAVVEKKPQEWNVKLVLMSCRVMSKGVGSIMLQYVMKCAAQGNNRLVADFVPTDRNRIMYITYKFSRFKEVANENGLIKLEADLAQAGAYPPYVIVNEGAI